MYMYVTVETEMRAYWCVWMPKRERGRVVQRVLKRNTKCKAHAIEGFRHEGLFMQCRAIVPPVAGLQDLDRDRSRALDHCKIAIIPQERVLYYVIFVSIYIKQ